MHLEIDCMGVLSDPPTRIGIARDSHVLYLFVACYKLNYYYSKADIVKTSVLV
jgi:hypothetical protein